MNNDYLSHHGIKGQRWGIRRFQNRQNRSERAKAKKHAAERKAEEKLRKLDDQVVKEARRSVEKHRHERLAMIPLAVGTAGAFALAASQPELAIIGLGVGMTASAATNVALATKRAIDYR